MSQIKMHAHQIKNVLFTHELHLNEQNSAKSQNPNDAQEPDEQGTHDTTDSTEHLPVELDSATNPTAPSLMPVTPLTPKEIVKELDRFIIGQNDAKRAVANALRNRLRRMRVDGELRQEITPKNILMIGPTGVGKTEIARRLAKLANAPFVKVEATKFTEIGYVGRDVESIIRDLIDRALKMTREAALQQVKIRAATAAEERILDILLPSKPARSSASLPSETAVSTSTTAESSKIDSITRQLFRKKLRSGEMDDKEIEVDLMAGPVGMEIMGPPGMEEMVGQLQNLMENMANKRTKKRKLKIKDALKQLQEDEAGKLLNEDEIKTRAIEAVEQNGIVFIDEIDKIVKRADMMGGDVSREGVQRDLLPIVEGSTVFTKYGMIRTDHILFIASGAFHLAKPSDLIPELQGRFPIRVELNSLSTDDFVKILTEPSASLIKQYKALLETEQVNLEFSEDGIRRIAEIAFEVNDRAENIGARRLHTILERLLETISFEACDMPGATMSIDAVYVNQQLTKLVEDEDLSQYIL